MIYTSALNQKQINQKICQSKLFKCNETCDERCTGLKSELQGQQCLSVKPVPNNVCCQAITLKCELCQYGISEKEYCNCDLNRYDCTTPLSSGIFGYETIQITEGYNLIGLRLHGPEILSGTFEKVDSNGKCTDTDINFTTILNEYENVMVELQKETFGDALDGYVLLSNAWNGNYLNLNLLPSNYPDVNDIHYTIREARTFGDIFGSFSVFEHPVIIYIQGKTIKYINGVWKNCSDIDCTDFDINTILYYPDAITIYSNYTQNLVVTGMVKETATVLPVFANEKNNISMIYPGEYTLENLTPLEKLKRIVSIYENNAIYRYVYEPNVDYEWQDIQAKPVDSVPLPSGVRIEQYFDGTVRIEPPFSNILDNNIKCLGINKVEYGIEAMFELSQSGNYIIYIRDTDTPDGKLDFTDSNTTQGDVTFYHSSWIHVTFTDSLPELGVTIKIPLLEIPLQSREYYFEIETLG